MAKDYPVTKPLGRTGSANVMRQGHTASGQFGDDPNPKSTVKKAVRDLNV